MKQKKLHSVVALLLTIVMVTALLPTPVYAAEADGGIAVAVEEDPAPDPSTDEGEDVEEFPKEDPDAPKDGGTEEPEGENPDGQGDAESQERVPAAEPNDEDDPQNDPEGAPETGDADTTGKSTAEDTEDLPEVEEPATEDEIIENPEPAINGVGFGQILYGSAANMPPMSTYANFSGVITTGNDFGYARKWLTEFGPYTSCKVKSCDGYPAYCIEPHKGPPGDGQRVNISDYYGNDTLRLALAYGLGGVNDWAVISAANGYRDYAWLATQEVIWEIVGGYSDLSDLFIGPNHSYDAEVAVPIANAHAYIWNKINQQYTIPSFSVASPFNKTNDIELSWNGTAWTATVTDTNYVLPNFDNFRFALSGLTVSQSRYTMTITATPEAAKSMLSGIASQKSEGNAIDPDDVNAYLIETPVSGGQDCVTLHGMVPDPVAAYVRAKVTKTTGDLIIAKTAEDGKVSGISFTVTGPNNYSKSVTTDAAGKITLADLQPGTYTVTEATPDRYVPAASQTITLSIGDVKTVTFKNVLKKGTVKVTKTSEDGLVEGVTFRLTGTSAAGTAVNMTAVTNAQGVAVFNDVPIGRNYKLEEVNTAARYVVPAVQAGVVVEYNVSTDATFKNKLARGRLRITKTSEDGLVEGITFRLSGTSLSGAAVNMTAVTDASGVAVFDDVLIGTNYTVQEVDTAERYVVPAVQAGVTITLNTTTDLKFTNTLARGSVEVKKTSEDGLIEGVTFRLHGVAINGETVDVTAVTNAEGIAVFDNILIGNGYSVEEVGTAARYVVPEVKAGIKVSLNTTTTVEIHNALKRGNLRVTKTSEDGLVEGVTFRLYGTSLSGEAVDETAVTNAEGVAIFSDILIGSDYTLEEVGTAVRYVVPAIQTGVTVAYQKTTDAAVRNALKKWSAKIIKTDLVTGTTPHEGRSFEGAVYGLYKDGELVKEYTIGADGSVVTDEYICGDTWTIKEIRAPEGYLLDKAEYHVGAEAILYQVEHNQAADIVSVEQAVPGVKSVAKNENGSKTLRPAKEQKLLEHVELTDLLPGKTYVVKGWLVLKDSEEPLLDENGDRIEMTAEFEMPEDFPGYVELLFTFDASDLNGKDLVVCDELYQDGELVANHADLSDAAQTVMIRNPSYYVPPKESPVTADAGIGAYLVAAAMSLEGSAALLRRRRRRG